MTLPDPAILVITDRHLATQPLRDVIESALDGGCRWILLREPDLDTKDLTAIGQSLAPLCHARSARLSVSADLETATAIGAGGIHLPQRLATADMADRTRHQLGPDALIGVSCHSLAEATAAQEIGADYISLSPIFLTASKPGYGPALGTGRLREMTSMIDLPVLALGGIGAGNAANVYAAGAAGFAVLGNVMRASDPASTVASLVKAWRP